MIDWLKQLSSDANAAEGCRQAMRLSYKKHLHLAQKGKGPRDGTSPHIFGLYGALASRYITRGVSIVPEVEVVIWGELVPFIRMSEKDAPEALAEYVVYQEIPGDARISWLKKLINEAFRMELDSEDFPIKAAIVGVINQVSWCDLLDPEIKKKIEKEAERED